MAIVQISRITQRKGLQEDLPQLAGGELGWSVDTRRLFIGNGTLAEGAPVVGNTEVLTEFSDILALSTAYTYEGQAAGYVVQTGPTPGSPITQSLQSWMDQWASIKDFGAVGDGVTDDTAAINRALYQIYCREVNPQIRRSIFFPAGRYKVTQTIIIPPYATLYGEGPDNSVIVLANNTEDSTLNSYVARTGDSLQQYGANIGNNGAQTPYSININKMGFTSEDPDADVFLLEDAVECNFLEVDFHGPLTAGDLTVATDDTACIRFASTPSLPTDQIKFYNCRFGGTTYAINTDVTVQSITVESCSFDTLYQGIVLGIGVMTGAGPTGFAISSSQFDNIYAEGIIFGDISLNATSQNIFYDVGNHFGGPSQPYTPIIDFQSSNNISVGDMFERTAEYATVYPRIRLNNTASIAFTNGEQLAMGTYVRQTGTVATLVDATASPTTIFTVSTSAAKAFCINYTIVRNEAYRTGTITVATSSEDSTGDLSYTDDYNENSPTGITFDITQVTTTVSVKYTATSTGTNALFYYSITRLA